MSTIIFLSDIHGVPSTLKRLLEHAANLKAERLVILGDLLYHGPRNGVPDLYDPQIVAELLNTHKERILCVRGNCDSEVDQMMLHFPIMSDYAELMEQGKRFFLTHGHRYNGANPPPIPDKTVLTHGHTHIPVLKDENGITIFNPGSISLPKMGFPQTFGVCENGVLSVRKLVDGEILAL